MISTRPLFAAASSLALALAGPLAAQDMPDDNAPAENTSQAQAESGEPQSSDQEAADAISGMLGNIFGEADPLTPEQEAALPMAQQVVEKIFPEGTYAKMMNDTMKPMMDGMMGSFMDLPINEIAKLTGLYADDLPEMGDGSINQVMAILDPAFEERTRVITGVTIDLVTETMTQIEPGYREGLARAYAVRFSSPELADLNTYFATPVGSKYAAESMLIYTDPQVMSAMNEMMPAMLGMVPQMMEKIAAANAELPAPRRFSELSDEERAKLSELLEVSEDELAEAEPEPQPEVAADGEVSTMAAPEPAE